jgi:serine/threonine-protein kinase
VSDLFVSYKAEDRARVAPLVQALETDGLSVWWDEHIGGGDEWRDTILRHLEAAKCVIVVWSKRSVGPHGSFVRDEATRALRRGTYLPVRIDKVEPPLGFGETQALDLQGWKGDRTDERYQAVLSSVRNRLGIHPASESPRSRAAPASRRTVLIGASAAGAVAIAGGGAWFFTRPSAVSEGSIAVLPFANLSGDPN